MDPEEAIWPQDEMEFIREAKLHDWDPSRYSTSLSLVIYGDIEQAYESDDDEDIELEDDDTDNSEEEVQDRDSYDEEQWLDKKLLKRQIKEERQALRERRALRLKNKMSPENIVELFEEWGVSDLLDEPYTLGSIRNVVVAHRNKQDFRLKLIQSKSK